MLGLILPLLVLLGYASWCFLLMEENVRKARTIGIPVVRLPIDPSNVPWTAFQSVVWSVVDRLPIKWSSYPDWLRLSRWGWAVFESSGIHQKYGPVFAHASPGGIYVYVADPGAAHDLLWKRKDFFRPTELYQVLGVFGHCISTAGTEDWARHRKVLAPPFSEAMMGFAWKESLHQGTALLESWSRAGEAGVPSMRADIRTFSLNVLASTALKRSYTFRGSADSDADLTATITTTTTATTTTTEGDADRYRDSLQTILDNILLLLVIPFKYLASPVMPAKWQKAGRAAISFQDMMTEMLEEESSALAQGKPGSGGIMTGFAQALKVHKKEEAAGVPFQERKGLSASEAMGNTFIMNFAGHDATYNTLSFAVLLLVAHPEVQEWVAEEVSAVTGGAPAHEWDYKTVYPRLKRCRAVILETLRLYPSFPQIPKVTVGNQTLTVGKQAINLPPKTQIMVNSLATQTHPDYWEDAASWNPRRWVVSKKRWSGGHGWAGEEEEVWEPERLIYMPWSDGPMSCLGRKMAEVELTAAVARLMAGNRLGAKPEFEGEGEEVIRARVEAVTKDVGFDLLLHMKNADAVRVVCRGVE